MYLSNSIVYLTKDFFEDPNVNYVFNTFTGVAATVAVESGRNAA